MDRVILKSIDNFIPLTWLIFIMTIDSSEADYRIVVFLVVQVLLIIASFIFASRAEVDIFAGMGEGWANIENNYFFELYRPLHDNIHWIIVKVGIFIFIAIAILLQYLGILV